ncbi:TetR-like C-terminal domain-containing protein [uncultured Clostridium sp.]|uniref:TetR-like C-terminal domain-containing protein n=1 Tax=Clostridium sp. TaxID=1506 RepID=UPI00341B2A60
MLFCKQKDNRILERILSVASKADFEKLCSNSSEFIKSNIDYFIRYSVGGCISIIQAWLENDLPQSPSELVEIINNINTFDRKLINCHL